MRVGGLADGVSKAMEAVNDVELCRDGLQRCREFLGGAWMLATIDQFSMEYIR